MIRYHVTVKTPYHGELFAARCGPDTIADVLKAGARALETVEKDLADGQLPVFFEVQVRT